ncbi:MAG TPA: hypothetical protein VEY91_13625 [Candidatus Limnocylindria bacterium]|nr:hypothetical protein [Candidatus Limnocylindria bacterium]
MHSPIVSLGMTRRAAPRSRPNSPPGSRPAATTTQRPATAPRPPLWPSLRELADPSGPFLVPLLLLLVARLAFWALLPLASEDAYITFRYARHLATGAGLIYNPGERVMGFSSPLWTVWMGAGYALVRDPVLWSRIWAILADVTTLLLIGGLLKRHASLRSAWCFTFFFAAWPYFSAVAVSGMENGVLLAMIALAGVLVERGSRWSGPALAAVAFMRPEGVASALVLGLGARNRDRLIGLGLLAAGAAALAFYFGSFLPQSVLAKSQLYGTPGPWAGRGWWEWLLPFAFGRWPILSEATHLLPLTIVFAPAVVSGSVALWRARRTALAHVVGAMVIVWIGYALLGVAYFYWYLAVPLGGLAALAAVGLPRLVQGRGVLLAIALYVLGTWTVVTTLYLGRAQNESFGFARVSQYLQAQARPGERVMLEPIGLIGYRTPLVIVDEVGLVSPAVAKRRLQGPGWYADVARETAPEWLVVRRGLVRQGAVFAGAGAPFRSAAERDALFAGYRRVHVVEEQAGDQAIEIYRRAN